MNIKQYFQNRFFWFFHAKLGIVVGRMARFDFANNQFTYWIQRANPTVQNPFAQIQGTQPCPNHKSCLMLHCCQLGITRLYYADVTTNKVKQFVFAQIVGLYTPNTDNILVADVKGNEYPIMQVFFTKQQAIVNLKRYNAGYTNVFKDDYSTAQPTNARLLKIIVGATLRNETTLSNLPILDNAAELPVSIEAYSSNMLMMPIDLRRITDFGAFESVQGKCFEQGELQQLTTKRLREYLLKTKNYKVLVEAKIIDQDAIGNVDAVKNLYQEEIKHSNCAMRSRQDRMPDATQIIMPTFRTNQPLQKECVVLQCHDGTAFYGNFTLN